MNISKPSLKALLKSIKTIENETLTEKQLMAVNELKEILNPPTVKTTYSATNKLLTIAIIEKTTQELIVRSLMRETLEEIC